MNKTMDVPKIMVQEKRLSVLVAMDSGKFSAYCPELDLATEMDTYEETIGDIIEAIKDYAEEYMTEFGLYSKSPNRVASLAIYRGYQTLQNRLGTEDAYRDKTLISFRKRNGV